MQSDSRNSGQSRSSPPIRSTPTRCAISVLPSPTAYGLSLAAGEKADPRHHFPAEDADVTGVARFEPDFAPVGINSPRTEVAAFGIPRLARDILSG